MTRWLSDPWVICIFLVVASIVGLAIAVAIPLPADSTWGRAKAKCDEAAQTMLTTNDPVELQRSMFLIERINCSVQRRLP